MINEPNENENVPEEEAPRKSFEIKRISMAQKHRTIALVLSAVSLIGGVLTTIFLSSPTTIEEERVLFSYELIANTQIEASLRPNELYESTTMTDEQIIPYALTESLTATVNAQFVSSEPTELQGEYAVYIDLRGIQSSGETVKTIYEIRTPISDGAFTQDESNPNVWTLEHSFPLDLNQYSVQAAEAANIIGASPQTICQIVLEGHVSGQTEYGNFDESFAYNAQLPISEEAVLLEFTKDAPLSIPGQLTEPLSTLVTSGGASVLSIFWIVASAFAGLYIMFFTRVHTEFEHLLAYKKDVIRKHGSRMIATASLPNFYQKETIAVFDVDNLVLISEELHRPIFYCKDTEELIRANKLYIQDSDTYYVIDLTESLQVQLEQ